MPPVKSRPLPKGAVRVSPSVEIVTGTWKPQRVDAYMTIKGLVWARVEGGFGDSQRTGHPREDWIAIVPSISMNLSQYFDSPVWNNRFPTMEDAAEEKIRNSLTFAYIKRHDNQRKLESLERGIRVLGTAWRSHS
jgi:hypothetical protein